MNDHIIHTHPSFPSWIDIKRVPYRDEWERFFIHRRPAERVRRDILPLWQHVRAKAQSEGFAFKWTYRLPEKTYWSYLSTFAELSGDLKRLIGNNPALLLLCDEEGTVLDLYPSNHPLLYPPFGFKSALHLSDADFPPTALNLALRHRHMSWMVGAEHPYPLFHTLTSLAWPLPVLGASDKLYLVLLEIGFPALDALLQLGGEVHQFLLERKRTPATFYDRPAAPLAKPPVPFINMPKQTDSEKKETATSAKTIHVDQQTDSELSEDIVEIVHELRNPLTALRGYLAWQREHLSTASDDKKRNPNSGPTQEDALIITMLEELKAVTHLLDRLLWRYHTEAPWPIVTSFSKFIDGWFKERHGAWHRRVVPRIILPAPAVSASGDLVDLAKFDPKQIGLALALIMSLYDPSKLLTPVVWISEKYTHLLLKFLTWSSLQDRKKAQDWESARRIVTVNRGRLRRFEKTQLITLTLPRHLG
ncbi:MAG: hypothetical protein BSOLF_1597 [Candidatus Carbobacillus altaicus]|uniref:histidine kinase n=1 Tax=Candidatus Carbonibacillus altaicus TaxID=2163959 RepID=A0A2R6Y462_9BACL|nr:MAG: hypothetical protein BSOLF_1597 [Candidatus Carbobacillus altaicus]